MKTRTSLTCLFASFGAASLVALSATAQTPVPSTTTASLAATADSIPVKLPYGADDILKLSRAQVSEDVTLNFIRNSGTIYNLAPKDIVYLRNEGVSDRVVNAMLGQRKNVPAELAAQNAAASVPAAPQTPAYPDANAAAAAQASAQYAPAYAQPDTTYAPASTVYTIPYSTPAYPYYYSGYPYYYGGYPYFYGPSIRIGFGFGGGRFHGTSFHSGGFHGGGGHGGHR